LPVQDFLQSSEKGSRFSPKERPSLQNCGKLLSKDRSTGNQFRDHHLYQQAYNAKQINILLVDDHALFSKSLEIALSDYPEIEAFDSINDISRLDSFIASKKPNIILIKDWCERIYQQKYRT